MSSVRIAGAIALGCAQLLGASSFAQSSELPDPPKPLFQSIIPEGQQCVTKIRYPALEKALADGRKLVLAPYPLERTFAMQNNEPSIETEFNNQLVQKKFKRGKLVLGWSSKTGTSFEPETSDSAFRFREAFPELHWVEGQYFKGETTYEGRKYLEYRNDDLKLFLLIDRESLLPQRAEDRGHIYRYSYGPVGKGLAQMPPELEKLWQDISKKQPLN